MNPPAAFPPTPAAWRERLGTVAGGRVPGTRQERAVLWSLLGLAAVLRMWDLPHLPFMHDEISALVRLFPSWRETLQRGVIEVDTHPPGVQFFEWIWTRAFGSAEWVVKLPFILLSIAAIFHLYRFACAWAGSSAALIAAALMATLQYFVLYGQLARPYAFALFTTLASADHLTRFIALDRRRDLLLFGILSVANCYAHHFALLQTLLIGGTGALLVKPQQRKHLSLGLIAIAVCYLPNVPITLRQLGMGGLSEWLAPPDRHWIPDYAWWIVHCSPILAVALAAVFAWSFMHRMQRGALGGPVLPMLLSWGLAPLLAGLAYSSWRAPVIQYSVLIFSFPFLLVLLLSGLRALSWRISAAVAGTIASIAVFTLVRDRRHHALLYHSKYEAMIELGMAAQERFGTNDCLVLLDAPDHVIRFYLERWGITDEAFPYVQVRDRLTGGGIDSTLHARRPSFVFLGMSNGADTGAPARLQSFFPYLIERTDLSEGQMLLFASRPVPSEALPAGAILDRVPIGPYDAWRKGGLPVVRAAGAPEMFLDHTGREFGIEFQASRDTLGFNGHDRIEVWGTAIAETPGDRYLALELKNGDSTVHYRNASYAECRATNALITTFAISSSPADIGPHAAVSGFKTYFWDRDLSPFYVQGMCAYLREGNPVQYGLFQPLHGEWTHRP